MPYRAAVSTRIGVFVSSTPHTRIVLTPMFFRSRMYPSAAWAGGPYVMPLTCHGAPLTVSAQLPCEPVTLTVLGPAGIAGSVIAAGVVPLAVATLTESTLITPPEVVSAVGVVT